jgi:hypothetical protein
MHGDSDLKSHQIEVQYQQWEIQAYQHHHTYYCKCFGNAIVFEPVTCYKAKACENYYACHHQDMQQDHNESWIISTTNAVVKPYAVVVKTRNAPVAKATMLGAVVLNNFARVACRANACT